MTSVIAKNMKLHESGLARNVGKSFPSFEIYGFPCAEVFFILYFSLVLYSFCACLIKQLLHSWLLDMR